MSRTGGVSAGDIAGIFSHHNNADEGDAEAQLSGDRACVVAGDVARLPKPPDAPSAGRWKRHASGELGHGEARASILEQGEQATIDPVSGAVSGTGIP